MNEKNVYPKWLNYIAVTVIFLVFFGVVLGVLGFPQIGAGIMTLGFLGIWVFGTTATKIRKQNE